MKKSRHCGTWQRNAVAVAVASCFVITSPVYANPIGADVVNGVVSIAQQGNTLNITNSPGAIINWQSFSIGMNEATRFLQQSAASSVLNRVTGVDPSSILGALQSNGRVFLINPNGVLFGAGAQVDVAGLVVSTLNLSNADFLAGRYNFTANAGAGGIDNQGNLTALPGGQIYLVAPNLSNSGLITSPNGDIVLAAGNSVELVNASSPDMRVVISAPSNQAINLGSIVANSGRVGIYAGLINHHGIVSADTATVGATGKIIFKATRDINLEPGSVVSASGAPDGVHDGGEVRIIADGKLAMRQGSEVHVDGGADGGNGGFLELSGLTGLSLRGIYTGRAHKGGYRNGSLLLDPMNILIDSSGSTLSSSGAGTYSNTASSGTSASVLNINKDMSGLTGWSTVSLTAGRDITLAAALANSDMASGVALALTAGNDITVSAPIGSFGARFNHDLTMNAKNDININRSIWLGSNALNVHANTDGIGGGNININQPNSSLRVDVVAGGAMNFSGVNMNVVGGSESCCGDASTVVAAGGPINITLTGGLNVLAGHANASDGSANANAAILSSDNITINAATVTVNGGTVSGGSGAYATALIDAVHDLTITTTGQVAVRGGTVNANNGSNNTADAYARLHAGNDLTISAGSVQVQGGTVNMASPFYGDIYNNSFDASALLGAGNAVSITAAGAVEVLGGGINVTNYYSIYFNDADATALIQGQNVTVNAGSLEVRGGTISVASNTSSSNSYNILNATASLVANGDVSVTVSGAVEVLGGGITISGNDYDPFASSSDMVAAAAIEGQNVTIGAGSLTVQGGTISVASNSSSGQYNTLDVSAKIGATSGNLGITTPGAVQVSGGDVTFSNNSAGFSFDSNFFYADAKLYAANAVTITSGSLAVAGGSATLSGSPANNYLDLNAQVYTGVGDVTLATADNINVTGGTVNGANAGNIIYANAKIRAANEVLATVGGTAIAINAGTITGGDAAYADARIESVSIDTIRVSFTNLTSGGYSVNGIAGAITDGNSGFYAFGSPGILDSTLFFQYATPAAALTGDLLQQALNTVTEGALETGALPILNGTLLAAAEPSDEEEKKPTYTCQ